MEGHKLALGLFLAFIASGCAGMTGDTTESPGLDDVSLTVNQVENATGANYTISENRSVSDDFNFSSVARSVNSFFTKDDNLSDAPETVQSIVVALNNSEETEESFKALNQTSIEGYEARQLNSTNRTVLYGKMDNISFFVEAKGEKEIFSSAKELYVEMAEKVSEFNDSQS